MVIDHKNIVRNIFYSFIGGVASAISVSYILGARLTEWIKLDAILLVIIILIILIFSSLLMEFILSKFK